MGGGIVDKKKKNRFGIGLINLEKKFKQLIICISRYIYYLTEITFFWITKKIDTLICRDSVLEEEHVDGIDYNRKETNKASYNREYDLSNS